MEQEKERDYFWVYIGALIVAVIIGVVLLKSREMSSVPFQAYEETKSQVERQMQNAKP
jgi:hypothetical protein